MAGKSTWLEQQVLNWIKGIAFPAAPTAVFVALYNGDPTDAGTGGSEVTTTIRAAGRVQVTFGDISGKTITNSAKVDFGTSEGKTDVTHFALFDAQTGGRLLHSAGLTGGAQTINISNPVSFDINSLALAED